MAESAAKEVNARPAIVDPLAEPAWLGLVDRAPEATIFHHPSWLRLLAEQYSYPIAAWCITGDDGRLAAGLPVALVKSRLTGTRLISVPFSDACPPLHDPGAGIDPGALANAIAGERERARLGLEVRGELDAPGASVVERYVQHRLALDPDVGKVERGFSKSQVKRGINKAIREGVTIEFARDRDALARFYDLHVETRRHQGVPTQPRRFILRFAALFDEGLGFLLLARHRGRDIAAAVFLNAGQTLTYKYGASRRSELSLRPNNLLFMEAIRWGCEHGLGVLDFGRTDFDNEGLRAFKASWGAEESPLSYSYLGAPPPDPAHGFAGRAMSSVIRHSPPFVGRLVGATLYRSFA
jgi:CelD/BcsL family acetyltransferase involved in cellulose biosynthesis